MEQRWLIYGVKSRNNEGVTITVLQWRWLLVVLMTVSSFLIGGLSPFGAGAECANRCAGGKPYARPDTDRQQWDDALPFQQ